MDELRKHAALSVFGKCNLKDIKAMDTPHVRHVKVEVGEEPCAFSTKTKECHDLTTNGSGSKAMSDEEPKITLKNPKEKVGVDHVVLCGEHSNGTSTVDHSGHEPTDLVIATPPDEEGNSDVDKIDKASLKKSLEREKVATLGPHGAGIDGKAKIPLCGGLDTIGLTAVKVRYVSPHENRMDALGRSAVDLCTTDNL